MLFHVFEISVISSLNVWNVPPLNLCKEIQEGGHCVCERVGVGVCECVGVRVCLLISATLAKIKYFVVPSYSPNSNLFIGVVVDRHSVYTIGMCTTIT